MSAQNAVVFALAHVGDGYIWGATGWKCTETRREQQAKQYPEYRKNIMDIGAKWDGNMCWDCATFVRACAKAGGVVLPSGATSQWKKGEWGEKGTIDQLPAGKVTMLYREKGGKMQHTGLYLGDGTVADARGTKYGVLHGEIGKYAWTHYAIPKEWLEEKERGASVQKMEVTAESGGTVNMRAKPDKGGSIVAKVPLRTEIDVLAMDGEWATVMFEGLTGYMMAQYLKESGDGKETLEERVKRLEERVTALEGRKE